MPFSSSGTCTVVVVDLVVDVDDVENDVLEEERPTTRQTKKRRRAATKRREAGISFFL